MALTRAQLGQLLDSADGLIALASSAGEFVRTIRGRTVSVSTITYLHDSEDNHTAYFLPPGFSGWPTILYAFTAVDRLPGAWDRIARFVDLVAQVAELRGTAHDAAGDIRSYLASRPKARATFKAGEFISFPDRTAPRTISGKLPAQPWESRSNPAWPSSHMTPPDCNRYWQLPEGYAMTHTRSPRYAQKQNASLMR